MEAIRLENICKKFGNKLIFDNYSLTINQGEFVSIIGESGKGKTTLLNIIGMLERPDAGNVIIKGVNNPFFTQSSGRKLLRNNIIYLFQNNGLVESETVKYNLEICNQSMSKRDMQSQMKEALKNVGLTETDLKRKIYELSGGEQQRVAIARIYLKPADIILADEPTGSLDHHNRDIIMNLIRNFHKEGKTIVVVTHDKEVAECSQRVIEL
ncbi:putative bacteriocin export ABC transporter [Ruminococcus sp.]|uniref:putative bacteriocin export ABC transporter n=1 Tax=Ruminococcus sp. TaxID=41978 RepID=UPI0025F9CFE9|nr:putative bacteriocin export ABC transporter [Ruminococcus sp.]